MDSIFDRAHDLVDKAQEKLASATSQAAWAANQALVVKNLEGQVAALQSEIERVTSDIGERTYQAWKARADDPRVPALCAHLDDLKNRRAQLSADLNRARTATYNPRAVPAIGQRPIDAAATSPSPGATLPPQTPTPTIAPPVQGPPRPAGEAPHSLRSLGPAPPAARAPAAPSTPPAQQSGPAAPRATTPARECPNCGHFVPAGVEFCPSCGFHVT